jgi:DNA-binding transcriptional LysR family regulator
MAPSRIKGSHVLHSSAVRYFLAVAQTGSFRGASEILGIAASAIHRQVGLLERHFRAPLLERRRGRDGVRITQAGEMLLSRLNAATFELAAAAEEIESVRSGARGVVSIGTTEVLAHDLLPKALGSVSRSFRHIDLDVMVAGKLPLVSAALKNQLDILLVLDAPIRMGLKTLAEFSLTSAAVVPINHPLAQKPWTTLGECATYPLALSRDAETLNGLLNRMSADARTKPRIALNSNSYLMMRDAVAEGMVISIQTELKGAFRFRDPRLAYVPIRESLARFSVLSCCVPADRRLSPAASATADHLVRTLHAQLGDADVHPRFSV